MSALESRIPSRMLSSVEWMARGDLNGNYCNTANHASIYKSGLRALRTHFPFGNQGQDAAVLPQQPHLYHIPTPAELSGIQVLLSLAFMGNAERKEEGSWNACSYLSHHINTVFWHWMWLASKGDGNAALLFGKASLSCSFSGHKKEREENKNSKRKKGNEKKRSKTKNIGKREKQRQICFSELLHFSVEPDLLQVGRRCCTTL